MRLSHLCVTALLLVGCGDAAAPADGRCSLEDTGTGCTQGTTTTRLTDGWQVSLRSTVRQQVTYEDHGFVCTRTVTSCVLGRECTFHGATNWSASQAISECQKR